MIPLRDVVPSRAVPQAIVAIIAGLLLVYLLTFMLGDVGVLRRHGLTPAAFSWLDALSAPWLHASAIPVVGHVLALWVFGASVEDRLGHGRVIVLYAACAVCAPLVHAWVHPGWPVPAVGAGGAVAGVIAAHLVLYPASKVLAFAVRIVEVPAPVFAAAWLLLQVIDSTGLLSRAGLVTGWSLWVLLVTSGVGAALAKLLGRPERARIEWFYREA